MNDNNFKIITYDGRYNDILGVDLPLLSIVQSNGLEKHISKKHPSCLKYLNKIYEIIISPDYIGINPKETDSFELIKRYDDNILIGIKLQREYSYYAFLIVEFRKWLPMHSVQST